MESVIYNTIKKLLGFKSSNKLGISYVKINMNYGGSYCPKCRTFHQCTCENCSKESLEHPAVAYTEGGEGMICQNGECGITFGFDAALDTEFDILFESSGVSTLKEYLDLQQKDEDPQPDSWDMMYTYAQERLQKDCP